MLLMNDDDDDDDVCRIRYFVLDEADKACDIEMENQIRTVCFSTEWTD